MPFDAIVNHDDVRWALGNWILEQEKVTPAELKKMVTSARELALYVDCMLRLKDKTDEGFNANYFSPLLRADIRKILDEMDSVSDGTHTTIQRRNAINAVNS